MAQNIIVCFYIVIITITIILIIPVWQVKPAQPASHPARQNPSLSQLRWPPSQWHINSQLSPNLPGRQAIKRVGIL